VDSRAAAMPMEPLPFPKAKRLADHGEVVSGAVFADPLVATKNGCELRSSSRSRSFCISRELEGSALRDGDQPGLAELPFRKVRTPVSRLTSTLSSERASLILRPLTAISPNRVGYVNARIPLIDGNVAAVSTMARISLGL
jgi:hypothetical protein